MYMGPFIRGKRGLSESVQAVQNLRNRPKRKEVQKYRIIMKNMGMLSPLLNVLKYSNSVTKHRWTRNLNASVYILSIN